MTSSNQNQINRLMKDIASLHENEARETKKEADIIGKINRANVAATNGA